MCTLVAWLSVFPEAPLVVAANRDERLGRPSSGPQRHSGGVPFVAPVDRVAGGSWWAVNARQIFIGLTNRAGAMRSADRRSRGLIVTALAQLAPIAEVESRLGTLDPLDFNGFHLFATDGAQGLIAVSDGETMRVERLGPGRHVVTERGFGAEPPPREAHVRELMAPLSSRPLDLDAIASALRTHVDPPFESLCVHVPEFDYATRSSTVYARMADGSEALRFAPGPPCTTPFADLSALLRW